MIKGQERKEFEVTCGLRKFTGCTSNKYGVLTLFIVPKQNNLITSTNLRLNIYQFVMN